MTDTASRHQRAATRRAAASHHDNSQSKDRGPGSSRMPDHEREVIADALAILSRYVVEPGVKLEDRRALQQFLQLRLSQETAECFAVLYLDQHQRSIAFEVPFRGTVNHAVVYPREIARSALLHNATAVILAHNHPSGGAAPSKSDEHSTQAIVSALDLLGVRVLDHFIVTRNSCASMLEMGLL